MYKGTFERDDELVYTTQDESNAYREHVIQWEKDLARSIDITISDSRLMVLAADIVAVFEQGVFSVADAAGVTSPGHRS